MVAKNVKTKYKSKIKKTNTNFDQEYLNENKLNLT